jgi:diguanylate cyclase (GGDEF)-like protein
VGNRHYAEQILENRLHELTVAQIPFGVIALDLDHFTQFNATYDSEIGDNVLIMLAETFLSMLRSTDGIARWEQDESVAIIPNITQDNLFRLAERIRSVIAQSFLLIDNAN